ncbi:MAG: methyltransferase domain-containing protein [Ruminococcus sp.]|nr:methyltransferase domain-containing protein [Ruminococcus sp.]
MRSSDFALQCPVCGLPLQKETGRYRCVKNHCFDCARSGYVNLLLRQSHRLRGDDPAMVSARRSFLEKGYYRPLLEAAGEVLLREYGTSSTVVLDVGCGEGWYSRLLTQQLAENGRKPVLVGVDISPSALQYAAKRAAETLSCEHHWAVASINRLPAADASVQLLLNFFAPCEPKEFARVLHPQGVLLRAIPLEKHLWELKEAVYAQPYENRPVIAAPEGFVLSDVRRIAYTVTLSGEDLAALFDMTPYARKTAPADREKLLGVEHLTIQLAFGLLVCRRQ